MKDTTTTTTTVDENSTDENTTVTAAPSVTPNVKKQGEVHIDKSAKAKKLKEQSADDRLDGAREEAMANHRREHEHDSDTNDGDVTSRDKE